MKQGKSLFFMWVFHKIYCIDTNKLLIYYENPIIVLSRGSEKRTELELETVHSSEISGNKLYCHKQLV
jgi:hypothetical protein